MFALLAFHWFPGASRRRGTMVAVTLWLCGAGYTWAAEIKILPEVIELSGAMARQRVLAEIQDAGASMGPATEVRWTVDDEQVARFEEGQVIPQGPGVTRLRAQVGDEQAIAEVRVNESSERAKGWEFRRHILPILSRAGCNQGACHGALAGKGGFRLSLRGYDPMGDYFNITQESRGRRVEPAARSQPVPHEADRRRAA